MSASRTSSESQLRDLLGELNLRAAVPLSAPDTSEVALIARVAHHQQSTTVVADRIGEDDAKWAEVWADPLAQGQPGLDLIGAVMRQVAAESDGSPVE